MGATNPEARLRYLMYEYARICNGLMSEQPGHRAEATERAVKFMLLDASWLFERILEHEPALLEETAS